MIPTFYSILVVFVWIIVSTIWLCIRSYSPRSTCHLCLTISGTVTNTTCDDWKAWCPECPTAKYRRSLGTRSTHPVEQKPQTSLLATPVPWLQLEPNMKRFRKDHSGENRYDTTLFWVFFQCDLTSRRAFEQSLRENAHRSRVFGKLTVTCTLRISRDSISPVPKSEYRR